MDLLDKIRDHKGWLEWLGNKIPGFNGYLDHQDRRNADVLLREKLATDLHAHLTRAKDVASQMLIGPGLAQLDQMGRGNTRLQTLIDKVKTASQGYAGFFGAIRINDDQLNALYEFDMSMFAQIEAIGQAIDAVQAALDAGEGLPAAVRGYVATITQVSALFDQRKQAMIELSEMVPFVKTTDQVN